MQRNGLNRRRFVGGVATTLGALAVGSPRELFAQTTDARRPASASDEYDDYDRYAKLANNENPYGPPDSVMKAMTKAFKYANRYGYPDGGITEEIAKHHGVKPENVMLGAGSGEILNVVGSTFASNGRKVVGVEPSYSNVYAHVTNVKGAAITVPLTADYRQDMASLIRVTKKHYREVGFVYLCNPNNPTGRIVTKQEVRELLDGVPEDMPVLIDEAYHHFVDDPNYATSVPYVLEGRTVIIARTFSKIAALAGMRLGYAIAPKEIIQRMLPFGTGTVSAIVRYGGVAALKDTTSQAEVKKLTLDIRNRTTSALETLGYSVIPSDANFFMVNVRRPMRPLIGDFLKKGILVGRPFPPMNEHLRISVGTADEMSRFMVAFKEIMAMPASTASG